MMKTTLIRNARAIVTCDAQDRVYQNADLLIQGPKITKIGQNLTDPCDEVIDASEMFVYPGLINTHHHFFQTFVRNLKTIDYPNMTVPEWLDKIYRIFQLVDGDVIFYSSLTAMADLLKHGCTCAFDHQYCYTKATGKTPVDRQMEAAKLLGIRYHAGRGTNTLPREKGSTMRMHTHLGEGENEIMLERFGKRTLDWCRDIGFIGPDVWYAHGWELTPAEYDVLGQAGSGVSHCPGPAILGGFPILPMAQMAEAGVCVSLGCDGSATNDSSSLLDSMRTAWMMQAWHSKTRGGCISPYDMLKIATVNGAKTLGRNDLGSLEPEKGADLFMIDAGKLELTGTLHDPRNLLARTGVTGETALTMVNGRVVFRDGVFPGIDERALAREGEAVCTKVLRQPCEAFRNLI